MYQQTCHNLRYELEQVTDNEDILSFADLIDEKQINGLKCEDLKEQLIYLFMKHYPIAHPSELFNSYREAVELIKNY